MKSKELFSIRFGAANKSGTGFLLEEVNSILLICTGKVLLEEFQMIANVCHKQINKNNVEACIVDFALMDTDMAEAYVREGFNENTMAIDAMRLAIVLPQKVENGQLVQHAWPTPKEHALTTLYTNSLSDALQWISTQNQHHSGKIIRGKNAGLDLMKERMGF